MKYILIVERLGIPKTIGSIDFPISKQRLHDLAKSMLEWYKVNELEIFAVREDIYETAIREHLSKSMLNSEKSQRLLHMLLKLSLDIDMKVVRIYIKVQENKIKISMKTGFREKFKEYLF